MGGRPAHRGGKTAGERERGDGTPCLRAEDSPQRGERGIVERRGDRGPKEHPCPDIGRWVLRMDERDKPERCEKRAERHHAMTAVPINEKPDARRYESRCEQREREPTHGKGRRPSALGRDQRDSEHRRIEDRSPGEDLRCAEHEHGAPGPGDYIVKREHEREWKGATERPYHGA